MLHLKHSYHFHLPKMTAPRPLELSPVVSEDDELIQEIEASTMQPWELVETPDVQGIDQFWNGVSEDLQKDPTWFSFADD